MQIFVGLCYLKYALEFQLDEVFNKKAIRGIFRVFQVCVWGNSKIKGGRGILRVFQVGGGTPKLKWRGTEKKIAGVDDFFYKKVGVGAQKRREAVGGNPKWGYFSKKS